MNLGDGAAAWVMLRALVLPYRPAPTLAIRAMASASGPVTRTINCFLGCTSLNPVRMKNFGLRELSCWFFEYRQTKKLENIELFRLP